MSTSEHVHLPDVIESVIGQRYLGYIRGAKRVTVTNRFAAVGSTAPIGPPGHRT